VDVVEKLKTLSEIEKSLGSRRCYWFISIKPRLRSRPPLLPCLFQSRYYHKHFFSSPQSDNPWKDWWFQMIILWLISPWHTKAICIFHNQERGFYLNNIHSLFRKFHDIGRYWL
jgi:hypothetical protein